MSGAPSGTVGVPSRELTGAPLAGLATWYRAPSRHDAAAGPDLRRMLGRDWRGSRVRVCADACVTVRLTDWCACGDRNGRPTLIDLDSRAFSRLAPLGRGVIPVSITEATEPRLPETSMEERPTWLTHR